MAPKPFKQCHCGDYFRRRDNEPPSVFARRLTCGKPECIGHIRAEKKETSKCFCGRAKDGDSDYCCWDHYIIYKRCTQWGIPVSERAYEAHLQKLEQEQQQINRSSREHEDSRKWALDVLKNSKSCNFLFES